MSFTFKNYTRKENPVYEIAQINDENQDQVLDYIDDHGQRDDYEEYFIANNYDLTGKYLVVDENGVIYLYEHLDQFTALQETTS